MCELPLQKMQQNKETDTPMTLNKTTDKLEKDWLNSNALIFLGSGSDVMMWC